MHSDGPMIHPNPTGHAPDLTTPTLFGMGALWGLVDAISRGLPPWNVVPPLLFALAALVTAISNARKAKS